MPSAPRGSAPAASRPPGINLRRLLILGTALLLIGAFTSAVLDMRRTRERTLREEEAELSNLSRALAGQTGQSIETIDVLLQDVAQLVQHHAVTSDRLQDKVAVVSAVDSLAVFDASGKLIASASEGVAVPSSPPRSPATSKGLTVDPGPTDATGRLWLLVSRQLRNASGGVDATIVATMDARHFQAFFGRIVLPHNGLVALYRRDGTVLLRVPDTDNAGLLPDTSIASALATATPALVRVQQADKAGMIALQPVDDLPLSVGVEITEQAALAPLHEWSRHLVLRWLVISGLLAGLVGIVLRELSRREAADARLRESEERYALAMAGALEGHWDWDLTGRTLYLSARLMQLLGYAAEDLVTDDGWFERQVQEGVLDQEQAARVRQAIVEHFRGHTSQFECEIRITRRGEQRWLLDRGIAMRDGSGRVKRMSGGVMDITERKRGEERLQRQAALLDLTHDALIVCDARDVITGWNKGAERTYGWSRDDARGRVSHELLQTRFPVALDAIQGELESAGYWQGELIHHRKDGAQVIADSRWTVQRDEHGRILRRLETNNDITERKFAEVEQAQLQQRLREAEKLEALGTLASGIAHDFNNILNAILGYGDMAHRATAEGSPLRRHVGNVLIAAQRAKALVDQILDYSRSRRGPHSPVDLRQVTDETLDLLRASLSDGIRLQHSFDRDPLVVVCDATQVHQIVMNLCTNAIQAMPAGGVLRVELKREDVVASRPVSHGTLLAGAYVQLVVADTGIGMDAELLKRMFEPFFTTKDPGAGTGLGLALVFNIITELSGAIDVDSAPGQGSTFRIYLPRFDAPALHAQSASALKTGSGQRVMVVEDDRSLLVLAEEILAALGYEPAGFAGAHDAIDALAAAPAEFDAALIDYVLPGMTGVELARKLREQRADLPIILLSGYRGPLLYQEAKSAGIVQVLAKPVNPALLGEALTTIVP